MSAPVKPWGSLDRVPTTQYRDERGYVGRPMGPNGEPPPLPPRARGYGVGAPSYGLSAPYLGSGIGGLGFGQGYGASAYGSRMYGPSYGMSSYGSPYDYRLGAGTDDGDFSPFQSVESVVRAISSLSMMMESTYASMSLSFRAVLGVADNMDKLRRVIVDLFGGAAIIRTLVWFAKKILYVLGLIRVDPTSERLWEAAEAVSDASQAGRRKWPLIAFFGLMVGGPFVLYKLAAPQTSLRDGTDPKSDVVQCVALYDFETIHQGELPFRRGEILLVRQRVAQSGWAKATKRTGQAGLVPIDRLKPISSAKLDTAPSTRTPPPGVGQPFGDDSGPARPV